MCFNLFIARIVNEAFFQFRSGTLCVVRIMIWGLLFVPTQSACLFHSICVMESLSGGAILTFCGMLFKINTRQKTCLIPQMILLALLNFFFQPSHVFSLKKKKGDDKENKYASTTPFILFFSKFLGCFLFR